MKKRPKFKHGMNVGQLAKVNKIFIRVWQQKKEAMCHQCCCFFLFSWKFVKIYEENHNLSQSCFLVGSWVSKRCASSQMISSRASIFGKSITHSMFWFFVFWCWNVSEKKTRNDPSLIRTLIRFQYNQIKWNSFQE